LLFSETSFSPVGGTSYSRANEISLSIRIIFIFVDKLRDIIAL